MSEFFGLFTFAIASALVFPHVIFPNFEPLTGTLLSFGVFSLMFIARPFARIFSRRLDHRVGRAAKITLAMFLLGGSTMAIGFVPSYQEIGVIAPILLCLARLGQGLGVGGIWDGLPVIMMLEAPEKRRSWYAMIPQLGAPLGFLISASIFFVLVKFLSPEEFLSWGWRFPFFVVLSLQVVALFARLRLIATPEYNHALESHHLRGALIRDVIRHQFMQVALGAYLPLAAYALFHMVAVFPLAYISLYQDLPIPTLLMMQMVGATIAVFTCILSGPLADRFGRRRFLMVIAVLIGLLSFNIVDLLDRAWVYVLLGFSLLGLSFGQSGGTLPHRFKPEYRFTGVSLTTDMAWLFGAAFAPIISLSLTEWLGIEYAGYYLLSGALATLASLYVVHRLSNRSR
ncbi:MAG: MFS transporter [Pseudomonadota bacterium]